VFTREVVFSVSSPAAGARQEHITGIPVRGDREVLRWQALSMRVHGSIPDFADRLADELGLVDLNEVAALLGESELSVGRAGGEVLVCRQEVGFNLGAFSREGWWEIDGLAVTEDDERNVRMPAKALGGRKLAGAANLLRGLSVEFMGIDLKGAPGLSVDGVDEDKAFDGPGILHLIETGEQST